MAYERPFGQSPDTSQIPSPDLHISQTAQQVGWVARLRGLLPARHASPATEEGGVDNMYYIENDSDAARLIESQGFVKKIPRLDAQVKAEIRDRLFTYPPDEQSRDRRITELRDFLRTAQKSPLVRGGRREIAVAMLESLNIIRPPELTEGAQGLAEYWKVYLAANIGRKLCVLTGMTSPGNIKSDAFMLDQALAHFTDEELAYFGKRIITSEDRLSSSPEDTRVVLLDDWIISAQSIIAAYRDRFFSGDLGIYRDCAEVNVLAATNLQLDWGIGIANDITLPVRAYWSSRRATGLVMHGTAYVSGLHATVDHDFGDPIKAMADDMGTSSPTLATIEPAYHREGIVMANIARLQAAKNRS